nr:MAG TPA: hypothetical protein [Caudoviricetes sp.]
MPFSLSAVLASLFARSMRHGETFSAFLNCFALSL